MFQTILKGNPSNPVPGPRHELQLVTPVTHTNTRLPRKTKSMAMAVQGYLGMQQTGGDPNNGNLVFYVVSL